MTESDSDNFESADEDVQDEKGIYGIHLLLI